MAVKIIRVDREKEAREREERIKAKLDSQGCLPLETYKGSGLFDLLHEPVEGISCKPVEINGRVWCMEDDHLFPVASGREMVPDELRKPSKP